MDVIDMLKYNVLLHLRNAALDDNEDPFILMGVPTRLREAIKHMSDSDIRYLLKTHPDLITLEFHEGLIGEVLDMIEKNATPEEIQAMVSSWLKAHHFH